MRKGKFKIHKTWGGFDSSYHYHFNLYAANGKVIATSETYNTRHSCINGINSVIKNAATATIEEVND